MIFAATDGVFAADALPVETGDSGILLDRILHKGGPNVIQVLVRSLPPPTFDRIPFDLAQVIQCALRQFNNCFADRLPRPINLPSL
jgi:hypothetical protein